MPTWNYSESWMLYVAWNAAAFAVSFIPHSFVEWLAHRFVLHSKAIVKFAYEEHDRAHHVEYGPDHTFHVQHGKPAYGTDFTLRDFALFLAFMLPIWIGIEFLIKRPVVVGGIASVLLWLNMFNYLHRLYHEPRGAWIEGTRYFRYLKGHHREHHADTSKNLNVSFFPIADLTLRTLRR